MTYARFRLPPVARPVVLTAATIPLLAGLSGCLISGHSNVSTTGAYVGPSTYSQIEPGTTRQDWVLATLGEPCTRTTLEDGSEIWKWSYTRTKSGRGSVFLLYSGSDQRSEPGATFVQLCNGIVVKKWQN